MPLLDDTTVVSRTEQVHVSVDERVGPYVMLIMCLDVGSLEAVVLNLKRELGVVLSYHNTKV